MTDDDLITHLAVGNLDPEPRDNRGCLWTLAVIAVLTVLYVLL